MKRWPLLSVITLCMVTSTAWAQMRGPFNIILENPRVHLNDTAAIERGARYVATQCITCHTLKHLRYNKIAKAAGITLDKMPLDNATWHFGAPPPDLSLVAMRRGAPWIYTYLRSFYVDPHTQLGSNNLLIHNSSMPNPFLATQGKQILLTDPAHWMFTHQHTRPNWYNVLKRTQPGTLSNAEFDQMTQDIVIFLVYASDPHALQREHIGRWVILFLVFFSVLALLLRIEYWKDVDG